MNTIDLIIPTMWFVDGFTDILNSYIQSECISNIYLIDNNRNHRPKVLPKHEKLHIIDYGRNIYVNPAWNEGYYRSNADVIGLLNDDIIVHNDIFKLISETNITNIDLIGVALKGTEDNFHIDDFFYNTDTLSKLEVIKSRPIGEQAWAFGICMFVKKQSYKVIPSLYQIWYGDDYLAQKLDNIYVLRTNKIIGEISKTLLCLSDNDDIQKRIALDALNVYNFKHFKNGKNWENVHDTINARQMFKTNYLKKPQPTQLNQDLNIFEEEYKIAKQRPSDINENLHLLYELAKNCKSVVEMGVRTGVSTRAFLNTDVDLISYDIALDNNVVKLFDIAKNKGKNVEYIKANVLNILIEETDMLFIDTLHTYNQLKQELKLHGNCAKKYIVFHDTHTFGLKDEMGGGNKGLITAIIEFLIENPHWKFKIHKTNNNGLTVLERSKCIKGENDEV